MNNFGHNNPPMDPKETIQKNIENKQPSNLEAEQDLLGSILVNNDIIDEISNIVNSHKFFDPAHKKIYEVITDTGLNWHLPHKITLEQK